MHGFYFHVYVKTRYQILSRYKTRILLEHRHVYNVYIHNYISKLIIPTSVQRIQNPKRLNIKVLIDPHKANKGFSFFSLKTKMLTMLFTT